MKRLCILLLAVGAALAQKAPESAVRPVTDHYHGVAVTDPYRWLEDQTSVETRAWIDAQTKYMRGLIDPLPQRALVKKRLGELMRTGRVGLPEERGGRYFFMKRTGTQNRASIVMRRAVDGADEVLVAPESISADESVSVQISDVTHDGKLLAYSIHEGGADEHEVRFLDVDSKAEVPAPLPKGHYLDVNLLPDHSGVYFSELVPDCAPRLSFRPVGGPAVAPRQVFGEGYTPAHIIQASLSEDGRWLVINAAEGSSGDAGEVWLLDRSAPGRPRPVVRGLAARSFGFVRGGRLYVMTNHQAPRSRVYSINPERPERHFWKLVIPEAQWNLEGLEVAGGRLFAFYTKNASSAVHVLESDGRFVRELPLPAIGTVQGFRGRWGSTEAFLGFESFATPAQVLRLDVASLSSTVWFQPQLPMDSSQFTVQQIWFSSKDRTRVPMFIAHRKGLVLNGQNPALLTGYGGFSASISPYFWPAAVVWMEQGGVLALANLRGGGEFGEEWHRAGMLDRKQNVFDDFIAAAETLVHLKYTSPAKLGIEGGSNGGLLVGAALTQRPDLFGAVVCQVPLLDMLRYHHFLVAKLWVPEYGSSDDSRQFAWLREYSPYQQVRTGVRYPAVLFSTGDSDTRVAPLHARKMTALLQSVSMPENPVLLQYDTKTGHSGGKPVNQAIEDESDVLRFLLWRLAR